MSEHQKTLRQRDLVLFTVSAILLPDTLALVASAGVSSITWWLVLAILFLVPFGLIAAELGCTYPEQGGIYAWVRDAFEGRWASRVTWCYWINVALWLPSIYVLGIGILNQLFNLGLGLEVQIAMAAAVIWLTVGVNIVTLSVGKWVPNIGGIVKAVLFLGIIYGAWRYISGHELANPINAKTLTPSWGEGLQYVPAIIYGMLGFELVSAGADEMRNPERDVPRAIAYSGAVVLILYVIGTVAVLAAVPVDEIDLVEGLVDTLRLFFADLSSANAIVLFLGCATLFSVFASGVAWALGGNRAAAEAAHEGELPRWFGIEARSNGTPIGAAVALGVASTIALISFSLLAGDNQDLFLSLFAFSGVLFLLPYVGMVLAFLRMRTKDGNRHRPFRVPGGSNVAVLCSCLCIGALLMAIFLFMYVPGEGPAWPIIGGVALMLVLGEVLIRFAERARLSA
ncbi:MAG: APC family permease [Pseudomonadota bacterium]